MSEDSRNALQVLTCELNFLEQGGYDRQLQDAAPSKPFLSSSTCLNFDTQLRPHACHECLLYDFVPAEKRVEDVPCHQIPLNSEGDTIASLLSSGDTDRLRSTLCEWLRRTIAQLELSKVTTTP